MTLKTPDPTTDLALEVQRIRESGLLGRPGLLSRLFDYLALRSQAGSPPKESEIALEIFSRDGDFSAGQDAVVRVYVHRLRKRLEDHYFRAGATAGVTLVIPRGEYRLIAERLANPAGDQVHSKAPAIPATEATSGPGAWFARATLSRRTFAAALGGLVLLNIGAWGVAALADNRPEPQQAFLSSPIWRGYATEGFPLLVVVGDYYIFADTDTRGNVERLVRDFSINSRDELYHYMMTHEEAEYRYMDLDLTYLPVSTAFAMHSLAPLIANHRRAWVVTTSQLTPQMLQDNDIIYIGYLSGLGPLREATFRASRLTTGANFDEILDRKTGTRYRSEGGHVSLSRDMFRDYGYFTTFPGPRGNRITIIAGTRDVAVTGTAEAVTDAAAIRALPRMSAGSALEALYEVEGGSGANLKAKLVLATDRNVTTLWSTHARAP